MRDPIAEHDTVAVLGLGVSGVGACNLLRKLGKRVIASDSRDNPDLSQLDPSVEVNLGANTLGPARVVVLSPGLNPDWPKNRENQQLAPIYEAWTRGDLAVWSEIILAAASYGGRVLAVGGTDGKSTTAALAAHLLSACGEAVEPAGNSWAPFSQVLADGGVNSSYAVLEVSAFQLWEPHQLRPQVAILTNVQADHLEHYAAEADYVAAKRQLFRNQAEGDVAVLFAGDRRLARWRDGLRANKIEVLGYDLDEITSGWDGGGWAPSDRGHMLALSIGDEERIDVDASRLRLPGRHNRLNALAALLGVVSLLPKDVARGQLPSLESALASFDGLSHRLELVRELDGVEYYNDSKATNVHAALTGINAIDAPLVAIVGGVDKELDLDELIETLATRARHVILIGELRQRLQREAAGKLASMHPVESIDEAVNTAQRLARAGDVVILSPAASSFDMFRSFEHRGEVFANAVLAL